MIRNKKSYKQHACVLVTCIRTYFKTWLIGLPTFNRGILPFVLTLQTKLSILGYYEIVTMSMKNSENLFEILHMYPEILVRRRNKLRLQGW